MGACMQRAPYPVAWRTPVQAAAGCGAFQRNGPTGGAAYGMPLKVRTLPSALTTPSKTPLAVRCSTERNWARETCGSKNVLNKRAHPPILTIGEPTLAHGHLAVSGQSQEPFLLQARKRQSVPPADSRLFENVLQMDLDGTYPHTQNGGNVLV